MTKKTDENSRGSLSCSFCGKTQHEVRNLLRVLRSLFAMNALIYVSIF